METSKLELWILKKKWTFTIFSLFLFLRSSKLAGTPVKKGFPLFISKCHLAFPNHWLCYTFLPIVFLEMLMILFSLQWLPKSIFNLVQMNKGEKCSTIWLSCKLVNYPRFHWRMRWSLRHSEIEMIFLVRSKNSSSFVLSPIRSGNYSSFFLNRGPLRLCL